MPGPYPRDRADRPIPGLDVSDLTFDECKARSISCPICHDGWATIFNPNYDGRQIVIEHDGMGSQQVLMRSVAYCVCAAGRKLASIHKSGFGDIRSDAKDVFRRTPDMHEVVEGRFYNWQVDDPTQQGEPVTSVKEFMREHAISRVTIRVVSSDILPRYDLPALEFNE